jgi:hypothetical protein
MHFETKLILLDSFFKLPGLNELSLYKGEYNYSGKYCTIFDMNYIIHTFSGGIQNDFKIFIKEINRMIFFSYILVLESVYKEFFQIVKRCPIT